MKYFKVCKQPENCSGVKVVLLLPPFSRARLFGLMWMPPARPSAGQSGPLLSVGYSQCVSEQPARSNRRYPSVLTKVERGFHSDDAQQLNDLSLNLTYQPEDTLLVLSRHVYTRMFSRNYSITLLIIKVMLYVYGKFLLRSYPDGSHLRSTIQTSKFKKKKKQKILKAT